MYKLIYTNSEKSVLYDGRKIDTDTYIKHISMDKEVFEYLQFLEKQEIEDMNLEDLYTYNGVGMYCFERHAIYEKLKSIFFCFFTVKSVIDDVGKNIIIETDNQIMTDICTKVFGLEVHKVDDIKKQINNHRKLDAKKVLKFILRSLKGIKSYIKFRVNCNKSKNNFLSISNTMNINTIKVHGKEDLIDTQLGIVTEALSKKYNMFNIQCLLNFKIIDKSLKYKKDYIPFEFFVLYKKFSKDKYMEKNLINDNLSKLDKLNYKYEDYDLKKIIMKYIFENIKDRYMEDIRELICARDLIKKHNIKGCIAVDEGDRPREFIMAGNMENIKTYAVQHGIINSMSPAYIINSKYKEKIIPNHTFVWGKKYKDILVKNTNIYDDNNVKVVGQSRTDLLKNYIRNKENNSNKIKILYATQYYMDILEPATHILFKALCMMEKEYEICIKLHPADTYYEIYESLIEKYNIKNVKIVKEGDLYDLINWCDVVVSVHSTVVVEGALLDKPSVCILLPKYNDAGGFVRDGVSMGAKNEYDLKDCLNNILEYKFDDKFNKYIEYNFYKLDGRITERIVSMIDETIR
ncbi:hypothetical protein [Clostridium sp. ZS2-4]|uniref:hypothetical protein n=1 Tax=Clostridium sp. ZS2-4 TaxID=2987703 RepID=UPI00227B776D|nr:hypothetical protein [Clostridium sp. ZS2-4]MCY6353880.1 hypothetical protein [Clostridium sp. ZS2-4]